MNQKQFSKYLERDLGCVHCGETEAVAPHHRVNRGMGGSKLLDRPSNIIVLCSVVNGLLESDPLWANRALTLGWKLRSFDEPSNEPMWVPRLNAWVLLDDRFNVEIYPNRRVVGDDSPAF